MTDEIVKTLLANLEEAINGLVDISELKKAYDIANEELTYGKEDYTSTSYNELKNMVEEARLVLAKENPSQVEVDLALRNINEGLKNLQRKANKDQLIKLYDSLNKSLANGEISLDKYTDESMNDLTEILAKAKELIENEDASQEDVDSIYEKLIEAHKNLEEKEILQKVDKEKLNLLYEEANSIDRNTLTPSSAKVLEEALNKAYQVLSNENVSQEEVDKAYDNLEKALKDRKIKANKDSLKALIEKYNQLDKNQYMEESYKIFEEVLAKAKDIYEDNEVSQEDVDKISKDLIEAFDKLEKKPSDLRKELEALVETAESELKKSGYSRQSVTNLKLRLSSAKRLLRKTDVSDEELKKNIEDLKLALKNLK